MSPTVNDFNEFHVKIMYCIQNHVLYTKSCTVYNIMYGIQHHVLCTTSCTVYKIMYCIQNHVLYTKSCTVYNIMYCIQHHVLCTTSCTVYISICLYYHWVFLSGVNYHTQKDLWLIIVLNVARDKSAKLVNISLLICIDLTYKDNIYNKLQGIIKNSPSNMWA